MPIKLMVSGARDLVLREHLDGESFEADVVNKHGRTLYNIFFEPYTRKFLFHSPSELHRDWARAGSTAPSSTSARRQTTSGAC